MTNATKPLRPVLFPRENLGAYWLLNEFRALTLAAVPRRPRGNLLRSHLERSTCRAALALGEAASSDQRRASQRLAVVRGALDTSMMLLEQMVLEERLSRETYAMLRHRMKHLLRWLGELEATPVGQWAGVSLSAVLASEVAAGAAAPVDSASTVFDTAAVNRLSSRPAVDDPVLDKLQWILAQMHSAPEPDDPHGAIAAPAGNGADQMQ